MVTKAKPAAEETESTTETPADAPVTKADVVEIVKSLLPSVTSETETVTTEPEAETETLTQRQEESRTHNIVLEKIQELKAAFDDSKTKEPEKKEPETVPGKKSTRKVEKWIWGVE